MATFEELPQTFSRSDALSLGWNHRSLTALQSAGSIEQISRGIFRRSDADLADLDLVEIVARRPQATLCLISALAHHELTDLIPFRHDVALPRGHRFPEVSTSVAWHKFDRDTFDVGRTLLPLDEELSIGLYDPMRSIVDAYRLPHIVSPDIAHEAMRRWLRSGGRPVELWQRALLFPRTSGSLLRALQILQ